VSLKLSSIRFKGQVGQWTLFSVSGDVDQENPHIYIPLRFHSGITSNSFQSAKL